MKIKTKLTSIALLVLSNSSMANNSNELSDSMFDVKALVEMGLSFGGDTVGELEYENGDEAEVTSGGGFFIGGGIDMAVRNEAYGFLLTASYHGDSATASNADVTFDRFVINAMPYYQVKDNVSFAAGLSFHSGVEYEVDYHGTSTVEFDSAVGMVAEIRYHSSEQLVFSGRATLVEYEPSSVNGLDVSATDTVSGNNIGLFMSYSFK